MRLSLIHISGIRLGYLLAQKDICEKIAHQLPEWNVSVVAQRIGMDILNDSLPGWSRRKYLKDTIEMCIRDRYYTTEGSNVYFQLKKDGKAVDPKEYLPQMAMDTLD